jgi:hypothetical protein
MTLDAPRRRAVRRRTLAVAALIAAGACLAGSAPGTLGVARTATPHEAMLLFFAEHLGATQLCDGISWSDYQSYSILFAGGGGSYRRSDCYERVAELRHDPSICWKVRPLLDLSPFSPGYSAWSCRRRVLSREQSATALPAGQLVRTFERMGYDIDRMPTHAVFPPPIRARDAWWRLERDPSAMAKARALVTAAPMLQAPPVAPSIAPSIEPSIEPSIAPPGAVHPTARTESSGSDSSDLDYLDDLVAHASGDARVCERIRPDIELQQEKMHLRDWCEFTVASNQGDVQLCQLLPSPQSDRRTMESIAHGMRPAIALQLSLRAMCEQQAGRSGSQRPGHYGATVPPDDEQIRRIIALLGLAFPSAHAWTVDEQAAYFMNVLFALEPGRSDPPNQAARAELVRRLLALSDDEWSGPERRP